MANQSGLFGNIYDAQLQDQLLREKAAQSYGTGWEAITRASAGAGGMLGQGIGQALGGQTPAMAKQQALQGIAAQFPDLDPGDPTQLRKVQSALWQAGLYDQANQVGEQAAGLEKTDILEEYYQGTVEASRAKADAKAREEKDLPQMTSSEETRIGTLVEVAWDFGIFDFFGEKTDLTKEQAVDLVFKISQTQNISATEAIERMQNGMSPNAGVGVGTPVEVPGKPTKRTR